MFSLTGTFVAVEGDESFQHESLSVMEKNLVTGEEIVRDFDSSDFDGLSLNNIESNQNIFSCGEESISTYAIIGSDDRQVVEDTTNWPYSAVAYIAIDWPGLKDSTRGTAWMISKNVAVTAAHNLYDPSEGVWAKGVDVHPGKDGAGIFNEPFGSYSSKVIGVSTEWKNDGSIDYDWGIIVLDEDCSNDVGFLDYFCVDEGSLTNDSITVLGYPSINNVLKKYNQYMSNGRIVHEGAYRFYYDADTSAGTSGGPVFDDNYRVIGIHVYSHDEDNRNSAVRITGIMGAYFYSTVIEYA